MLDAYALSYSTLPRKRAQGRIEFVHEGIGYFNREEVKFLSRKHFNSLSNSKFASVKEIIYNPLSFEEEQQLRAHISGSNYDLTPIIVVEELPETKLTIELDAKVYEDTKENIIFS